ncbi:hypothetical protein BN1049_01306 [Pseudomonas saudimassiliensis]|uniref:Uncharacterized protein n=2 Tax=Pseudomonas saudimassiliensis TaxID=1461581 RepID=A0A078M999_9PSED|nr:hypothetical protein BN1049_01306 [Pseudomonas saudimassiliensis]CEF26377.1 hypothetical protein BN1049_01306 [Pseudomonas saudimassiliensis]
MSLGLLIVNHLAASIRFIKSLETKIKAKVEAIRTANALEAAFLSDSRKPLRRQRETA